MQCGFNYFTGHEHDDVTSVIAHHGRAGSEGVMYLAGYDWAPHHVDLATRKSPKLERFASDVKGYKWEQGPGVVPSAWPPARSRLHSRARFARGRNHDRARQSQKSGQRVALKSTSSGRFTPSEGVEHRK